MNNSPTINTTQHEFEQGTPAPDLSPINTATNSLFERFKQTLSISELLRMFGACGVIASLSLFLLEGWADGNDIQRYLKLLGQTGLLTIAGMILSFLVKEYKGARLFFGLSLLSVVANFTILGSLVYSMFQLDGGLIDYPAMVTWKAIDARIFWPICLGATALLTLLARFSFGIFARKASGMLTFSFLALNLLLLAPVRLPSSISIIATIALLAAAYITKQLTKDKTLILTVEAKFALGLLFLPGLIIIARALSLYHVNEAFLLTLTGLAYVGLRTPSLHRSNSALPVVAQSLQYILIFMIAGLCTSLLPNAWNVISIAIFSFVVIGLSYDVIHRSTHPLMKSVILNTTTLIIMLMNISNAAMSNGFSPVILSLINCGALFVLFTQAKTSMKDVGFSRFNTLLGVLISSILLLLEIITLLQMSNWMIIGLSGVLLILGGSCYERFGLKLLPSKRSSTATIEPTTAL